MRVTKRTLQHHPIIIFRCILLLVVFPVAVAMADVAPETEQPLESILETPVPVQLSTATPVPAQLEPASPIETVVVKGYGAVIQGDKAAARDMALADARRMAVEQVAGVQTEYSSEIIDGMLVRDDVLTETSGIILDTRILKEGSSEEDMVFVEAEITVATDPLRALMFRLAPRDRITIQLETTPDSMNIQPVFAAITNALITAGYKVLDRSERDNCPVELLGAITLDAPAKGALGLSCKASTLLQLKAIHSDEIMTQICKGESVTGFGKTPVQATDNAMLRLAEMCREQVELHLDPRHKTSISFRVKGLPDNETSIHLINSIQSMRFVESVTKRDPWNAYMTKFTVSVDDSVDVMVAELNKVNFITVTAVNDHEIELEYKNE